MDLIFWESLHHKNSLVFFCTSIGGTIFWPLNKATFAESARVETSKKEGKIHDVCIFVFDKGKHTLKSNAQSLLLQSTLIIKLNMLL